MDNSPVYENFMNKMAAMQSKPKINATTMKIGGGITLEKRVSNNERKITAIKNIFKAQKIDIGEKIKPSSNTNELLTQTNENLVRIKEQLERDFFGREEFEKRKLAFDKQQSLIEKRSEREEEIETFKKNNKFVKEASKKIIKPFTSIFQQLKELGAILGTGLLINNAFKFFQDPEKRKAFTDGIKAVFDWTTENWKKIVAGAGIIVGLKLGATLLSITGTIGGLLTFLGNPLFLVGAGILIAAASQGFGRSQKAVVAQLEAMGGVTEENRKILLNSYRRIRGEIGSLNPNAAEIDARIKFLETGDYSYDGVNLNFDFGLPFYYKMGQNGGFSLQRPEFHDGGYVNSTGTVHQGEFVLNKEAVKNIGIDKLMAMNMGESMVDVNVLDSIDLRQFKTQKETSLISATSVTPVNPINSNNSYMTETPILFGFNDLVYT